MINSKIVMWTIIWFFIVLGLSKLITTNIELFDCIMFGLIVFILKFGVESSLKNKE